MVVATAPSQEVLLKPPRSVEVYEFSLSRRTGKFRFRLNGQEWMCSRLAGKWEVLGTDTEKGNLSVRCKLRMDGEKAFVFSPPDAVEEMEPERCSLSLDTHVRLCYNRAGRAWRLRDERTNILHSNDITDYRGVMNVNWFEGGPHIFHDGKVWVDEGQVAHFVS